jgi:hypothetical protein
LLPRENVKTAEESYGESKDITTDTSMTRTRKDKTATGVDTVQSDSRVK